MLDAFELSDREKNELAPNGELLIAIAVGPAASAVWCTRPKDGDAPQGVTVGIAEALADNWRLPLKLIEFASSGDIVEAAASGRWTLSFTPIDDTRRKVMEVGPNYYLGVSTYLARKHEFATVADVDRDGVRVVGVAGTATIRSAEKSLIHASIQPIVSLDEAVQMFRDGKADAIALGKESILSLLSTIDGAHAVEGHFHQAGTAVVAPKGHGNAIVAASRAVDALKRDGTMRQIFDRNGMSHAEVAP